MGYDPTGYLDWGSIGKGSGWLVVGISAVVIGASVLTCGVATPLMVGIAVATIGAGALTTINGIAEVGEGFTDYNFMKDGVFQGNESAYNTYSTITSTTATFGSLICGGWMALNKPRIQAYNNVGNYNFSGTLSDAHHMSRPFQSSTLAQKEVIKYGNMVKEAPGRYKFMLNGWKLVVDTAKEIIYHFGPF